MPSAPPPSAAVLPRHDSRAFNTSGVDARRQKQGRRLWPGARFTEGERARAVRRGLEFIYRTALDERNFEEYGSDYLWCFYSLAGSVRDAGARRMARRMGVERARRWRQMRRTIPEGATADDVADFAFGGDAADSLGLRDERLRTQVRRAAASYTARDFLLFDPLKEPPPADVPEACEADKTRHARGVKVCRRCGRLLTMRTRADVWYDALITAYVGERYGVRLGAGYAEVLRWLPALRPYPVAAGEGSDTEFFDAVYAVTHVVYTLNDYGRYRLSPAWLPDEYEFLRASVREAVRLEDDDMLGEIVDSLRAFGLDESDAEVRAGVEYLLARQNADGSWGDERESDVYMRYHPTWGAVAALSEFAFHGYAPRHARFKTLLRPGAQSRPDLR
jgi:hypothetical protein